MKETLEDLLKEIIENYFNGMDVETAISTAVSNIENVEEFSK